MQLKYENTFLDIFLFTAIHQLLSPAVQGLYVTVAAFIFWNELQEGIAFATVFALAFYLIMWVAQIAFNAVYLFSRKNHSVLTTHIVEITDDGFTEQTAFNKSIFYWHGIVKVLSRPGFIAVYVAPHLAHMIPSRAFESRTQRVDFLSALKQKVSESRNA